MSVASSGSISAIVPSLDIVCMKCHVLNIDILFVELLYKSNIVYCRNIHYQCELASLLAVML